MLVLGLGLGLRGLALAKKAKILADYNVHHELPLTAFVTGMALALSVLALLTSLDSGQA